ncbi:MAG: type II toxin-antitoxin system RelB/DinJ family antitoxin [Emergencia sp.]|nr:type II toxin-antitoxin system RelB/DinJ family antitoxin [Emergencia sp.]
MAIKTATVTARIQPEIKENAELILSQLGIPVSAFIDMAYRQVILKGGVPFSINLSGPQTKDSLTTTEFNQMMEKGLSQAKADESVPAEEVFNNIRMEL